MIDKQKIINIAVIAHVDAGKSTLVDAFLNQSGVFRANEEVADCVMDSDDIESCLLYTSWRLKDAGSCIRYKNK